MSINTDFMNYAARTHGIELSCKPFSTAALRYSSL